MTKNTRNIIHDLKAELDMINTCFNCIVFDVKENSHPSDDDIDDVKKSLHKFSMLFDEMTKSKIKGKENESQR
jgi:SMC interacting uncharacterized protein involved in chromosome segregation